MRDKASGNVRDTERREPVSPMEHNIFVGRILIVFLFSGRKQESAAS